MTAPIYKHIQLDINLNNSICYLNIDKQNSAVNTIDLDLMQELQECINYLKNELKPKALVIKSGKKSGFIAGADIKQFTKFTTATEAAKFIRQGQVALNELSNLPCTTIALVDGFCVGGGYELALACRYIIAVSKDKTKLGLPEVMLGIHPGWGGSIRLLKRIGSLRGLELILTGKSVDANIAKKLGMVDAVVKEYHIDNCIQHFILNKPALIKAPWYDKILLLDFMRPMVGKILIQKLTPRLKQQHYPAPFAVINNWVMHNLHTEDAYIKEADSVGELLVTPTAQNLVRAFFLRDKLKALGKQVGFIGQRIHVRGAGVMGGDIAAWCALSGYVVTLEDTNLQAIANSFRRARQLFTKKLALLHLVQAACDRLHADPQGAGISKADLIIEAIIEDLAAKQACFIELEAKAKPDAILATNTSTFPLEKISAQLKKPQRLVGLHFFNPVAKMQLVEVVASSNTDADLIRQCLAFVGAINKLPLQVTSTLGFLVNRILVPYLLESVQLFEEGIQLEVIDNAALDFGMLMGPMELADTVGLDICKAAAISLGVAIPQILEDLIKQGKLGKKTSVGFYRYKKGKKLKGKAIDNNIILNNTKERLLNKLLIAAQQCLEDKVVLDADLLDAGMIFGAGFAPFRGGPMQYMQDNKKNSAA
jgi:3-hydroxyacyl-CoA dehydrogenase/enoyl-CoA hydratase/3-hydroxybutyryl-CoA epimerase